MEGPPTIERVHINGNLTTLLCVCVNLTSGALSLSPPMDYQVLRAVLSAHLSAAVNKIEHATHVTWCSGKAQNTVASHCT
jgi:hypothetical protein